MCPKPSEDKTRTQGGSAPTFHEARAHPLFSSMPETSEEFDTKTFIDAVLKRPIEQKEKLGALQLLMVERSLLISAIKELESNRDSKATTQDIKELKRHTNILRFVIEKLTRAIKKILSGMRNTAPIARAEVLHKPHRAV